jgi:hypothetical protein
MEAKNPEFFRAYEVRLKIKEQIMAFNYLVSQQAQVTEKSKNMTLDSGSFAAPSTSSSFSSAQALSLPFAPFNPLGGTAIPAMASCCSIVSSWLTVCAVVQVRVASNRFHLHLLRRRLSASCRSPPPCRRSSPACNRPADCSRTSLAASLAFARTHVCYVDFF